MEKQTPSTWKTMFPRKNQNKDMACNSVMDIVIDSSLIDLLTKRYNPKVEYKPEAKDIFRDLTKFSGLK